MTTHYIDLIGIPNSQVTTPQLIGVLCQKLHLALVQHRLETVGISFPQYSLRPRSLGNVLRLHGAEVSLKGFMEANWLKGAREYVRMTSIETAPPDAPHRMVRRMQFKTSAERLRRRRMRRKGETLEEAVQAVPVTVERSPDLPFVWLNSRTTGQKFCLFVSIGPPLEPQLGKFNSYGLGGKATIPWF